MTQLQLPGPNARGYKPLLAWVALAATGLALWGTAGTTEPDAGALPEAPVAAVPGRIAAAASAPRHPIGFPSRAVAANAGDGLFASHSWYVPPPPPPPAKPVPPPAPTAPPLPFEYMGSYVSTGGGAVYYLVKGDRMFDAKLGDTIDGVYTVDAVQDGQLVFTYLPLKQRQALSLGR